MTKGSLFVEGSFQSHKLIRFYELIETGEFRFSRRRHQHARVKTRQRLQLSLQRFCLVVNKLALTERLQSECHLFEMGGTAPGRQHKGQWT